MSIINPIVSSVASKDGDVSLTSSDIANVAAGNITSITIQTALNELDTKKANLAGGNTFTGTQLVQESVNSASIQVKSNNANQVSFYDVRNDSNNYIEMGTYGTTASGIIFGSSNTNSSFIFTSTSKMFIGSFTAAPLIFATNGLERMRISDTGNIGIGVTPGASASLQIDSTTQGFLLPRMTTAQMNAIATPATGLRIYNTDLNDSAVFTGTFWSFEVSKKTTAIQSSTIVTYANITEFTTPSLPIGAYRFDCSAICQSSLVTNGIGLRLANNTATIGAMSALWFISQAANGTAQNFQYNQLATTTDVTSTLSLTANANFPVNGFGTFTVTVAGSVAIQIRTAGAGNAVSIRPESSLMIKRIG